jgi:hypothetical protein
MLKGIFGLLRYTATISDCRSMNIYIYKYFRFEVVNEQNSPSDIVFVDFVEIRAHGLCICSVAL